MKMYSQKEIEEIFVLHGIYYLALRPLTGDEFLYNGFIKYDNILKVINENITKADIYYDSYIYPTSYPDSAISVFHFLEYLKSRNVELGETIELFLKNK